MAEIVETPTDGMTGPDVQLPESVLPESAAAEPLVINIPAAPAWDINERLLTRYYMRTNPAGFDVDDAGDPIDPLDDTVEPAVEPAVEPEPVSPVDPLEEAAQIGGTESRDIVEDIETLGEVLPDVAQGVLSGTAKGFHQINKLDPTGILPAVEAFGKRIANFLGIDTGIDEPETLPGKLAEGFGQFLPGIIPATKVARLMIGTSTIIRRVAAELLGGAVGDYATSSEVEAEGLVGLVKMIDADWAQKFGDTIQHFITKGGGEEVDDFRARLVGAVPGIILTPILAPLLEGLIKIASSALKSGAAKDLVKVFDEVPAGMSIKDVGGPGRLPIPAGRVDEVIPPGEFTKYEVIVEGTGSDGRPVMGSKTVSASSPEEAIAKVEAEGNFTTEGSATDRGRSEIVEFNVKGISDKNPVGFVHAQPISSQRAKSPEVVAQDIEIQKHRERLDAQELKNEVQGSGGDIGGGGTGGARGERVSTTGQYIGAPKGIASPQALGGLRRKLQKITVKGEPGRFWYERSSRQILDAVGGDIDDADKLVQLIGIFSSGTDVASNFNYALQAFTQAKAGLSIKSGRFPARQSKAAQDVMDGIPWGGRKTNNFYNNLMVHIDPKRVQGVTTDIWIMRAFGFKNPDGTPFGLKQKNGKAGLTRPTDAQYDFVEREILKIADEMGWEPQQVQAAIWVAEKAKGEGIPVSQAKFDFADALQNNLGQVSWESIPGRTSRHMPEMFDAPYQHQVEYHQAVSKVFLDDAGNDIIAKELGIPSPRDFEAPGHFEGKTSPGTQTEVALPRLYKGPAYGKIDAGAAALVDAYAAVRGILLKQDGVGWHRPFYNATIAASNGIEIRIGRKLSTGETKRLAGLIADEAGHMEYNPISSPLGTRIINFDHLLKIPDGKGGFKPLVPEALKKNGGWIDENHLVTNKEFHAIVGRALNRMKFDGGARYNAKRFASQNGYGNNDWGVGKNGEGYLESSLKGRSDLQRKVRDIVEKLAPRIDEVDEDFAYRYGWTLNREVNSGYRRELTQKAILPAAALAAPLLLGGSEESGAELNEGGP